MEIRKRQIGAMNLLGALHRDFVVRGPDSLGQFGVVVENAGDMEEARLAVGKVLSATDPEWREFLGFVSDERDLSIWSGAEAL